MTPGSEPGGRWFDSNSRSLQSEVIRPDEEPVLKTGRGIAVMGSSPTASADDQIRVPGVIGSMTGSNPVGQGSSPWGHALPEVR